MVQNICLLKDPNAARKSFKNKAYPSYKNNTDWRCNICDIFEFIDLRKQ